MYVTLGCTVNLRAKGEVPSGQGHSRTGVGGGRGLDLTNSYTYVTASSSEFDTYIIQPGLQDPEEM